MLNDIMQMWQWIVLIILGLIAIVSLLYNASDKFRNRLVSDLQDHNDKSKQKEHTVDGIIGGILIYAVQHFWRYLLNPPQDKWENIAYWLFISLACAFTLWLIVKFVNKKINSEERTIDAMIEHSKISESWKQHIIENNFKNIK